LTFQNIGLYFPSSEPSSAFAPINVFPYFGTQWTGWARWYTTGGEEGMEPPAEIKELIDLYEKAISSPDEDERAEIASKMLQSNAENVWTIGTVANVKLPVVVNDNLKNVPESYFTNFAFASNFYPEVWYFEGGEAAK